MSIHFMSKAGTIAGSSYARVMVAGMCALIATVGFGRFSFTPLLPLMRAQADMSAMEGGMLAAANYAGYLLGAIMASTIRDLQVKWLLYRAGLVLGVLTTLGMGMTEDTTILGILRFLSGIASLTGLLLASGLILNWLIHQGHRPALGLHFVGMGVGIVATGIVVMVATPYLSWDAQWITFGLLGLVLSIPAWFWMPSPRSASKPHSQAQHGQQHGGLTIWLLNAAYATAGVGYVVLATFIVDIVSQLPFFTEGATMVWVMVGIAAIPSAYIWDRFADVWGSIVALILAFGLQIVSVLLLMTDSMWANLAAAIFYGGTFVGIVNMTLTVAGRMQPKNPARAMAQMTIGYSIAQFIIPAVSGYLARESGSYASVLPLSAIILGLGVVLLVVVQYRFNKGKL